MTMKKLHPALAKRAAAVKQAHAHLSKTVPGFAAQHPHERIRQAQAHVTRTAKGGY
jgi:hypothetical protein